jgi:uncharacterized protein YbaP (TraB family)
MSGTGLGSRPAALTKRGLLLGLSITAGAIWSGAVCAAPGAVWPLWVIKSGRGTVYLTGETPGGRANWSDARIEGLAPECGTLWTEAGTESREPIGPLMARYGLDAKTPLSSRLTDDDKVRLAKASALAHLPVERLQPFRPWLAAYQLERAYNRAAGLTGLSANEVLAADAKKAAVPIRSEFPSQGDTIAEYGSLSPEQDLQYLRYTLDNILAADQAERENTDWARGDVARATTAASQFRQRYPDLARIFFLERNRRWVPRIEAMLQEAKPSLVVVGNYHLLGPDGVLALLKADGLRPRRL